MRHIRPLLKAVDTAAGSSRSAASGQQFTKAPSGFSPRCSVNHSASVTRGDDVTSRGYATAAVASNAKGLVLRGIPRTARRSDVLRELRSIGAVGDLQPLSSITDAAPGSHREGRLSKEVHVTFDKLSDIWPAEAALARERLFFPWDHEYWRPNRSAGVEEWHEKQMRDLESQTEYLQRRFTSSNNNNSALAVDYPRKIANQPEMSGKRVWLRGLAANIQPSSAYTVVQEMCGGTAHPDLEALSKELSDRSASSMDSGLLPVAEDGVLKLPPSITTSRTISHFVLTFHTVNQACRAARTLNLAEHQPPAHPIKAERGKPAPAILRAEVIW